MRDIRGLKQEIGRLKNTMESPDYCQEPIVHPAINLAGIPIITYPGANGGIGIMEEYKINKKLFTTSHIATLLILLRFIIIIT